MRSLSIKGLILNAIYLDRSFNCAHYIQSLDRIHRLGLNPNDQISYHLLLARDSVDETVHSRLQEKMKNMTDVIESRFPGELPGYWSEDLGEEEDRDRVSREAVGNRVAIELEVLLHGGNAVS